MYLCEVFAYKHLVKMSRLGNSALVNSNPMGTNEQTNSVFNQPKLHTKVMGSLHDKKP